MPKIEIKWNMEKKYILDATESISIIKGEENEEY